jgi:hypothetical protein
VSNHALWMESLDRITINTIFLSSIIITKLIIGQKILMKDGWHYVRMVKYSMTVIFLGPQSKLNTPKTKYLTPRLRRPRFSLYPHALSYTPSMKSWEIACSMNKSSKLQFVKARDRQ